MRHWTVSVIVALLMLGLDGPQLAQGLHAAVVLHNRARLPDYLISEAQEVVSRIYSGSGVDLIWFQASGEPNIAPANEVTFRVIILSKDAGASIAGLPDAVGLTPAADGRHGRLAYIFGHRVLEVSRGYYVQPAIVLAGAMAHEIGHMLLSGGHTSTGLMRAEFNQSDFRRIATGELHLTSIEAADIRRVLSKSVTRADETRQFETYFDNATVEYVLVIHALGIGTHTERFASCLTDGKFDNRARVRHHTGPAPSTSTLGEPITR